MSTKGKESPSPKEKRVTSSAQPRKTNTLQQKKSPNTLKHSSPVKGHDSTAASERHTPNYLKPTICSSLDLSKHQVKKNASTDSKSNLTRRRSFDRPLLPFPIQKTHISPNPKERGFRSSSFTTRSTTSQKSLPDRLLKSAKDIGKGPALYKKTTTANKSDTNIKKEEKESSSTKEQITGTNAIDTPVIDVIIEPKPHQEDLDTFVIQVDEQVLNPANNNEITTKFLVDEDDRSKNVPEPYEVGFHEVEEEVKMDEPSMKGRDEPPTPLQIEIPEEIIKVGESSKSHSKLEEDVDRDNEETIESKNQVEDEEDGEAKPKENIEMDKKEEVDEGSTEDVQLQETENAESHAEEIEDDVDNEETKQQVIQGKNESSVSNDVIEETATKLREQRKNKVKALAGAFETVISLQEPK